MVYFPYQGWGIFLIYDTFQWKGEQYEICYCGEKHRSNAGIEIRSGRQAWEIGEVFERLIEDIYDEKDVFKGIREVYSSWLAEKILNFNSDLYYQSRQYLAECYKAGKILIA